ncbi:PREDICTED: F-box/kelch-repeat [Prunus dulcis]|uniref:PREDICTED: F-box/kelch-repeat n=1 Tax=Prunus dulcis TaxID=3755 RepID=A0A5E4EKN1_PRUDU|nr:F-box protein CPR1-like [Prunus dulcis]VVA15932.1 PREDICTED: F-box/kelch-repeat [Prunus dulcis]
MSDVYLASNILLFPDEILHEILLRSPGKSVVRCSAVCKSWNSLVNSFIRHPHTRFPSNHHDDDDDVQLLFLQVYEPYKIHVKRRVHYVLHRDDSARDEHTKLTSPFVAYNNTRTCPAKKKVLDGDVDVVGTCNGLVCMVPHDDDDGGIDFAAIIWNPYIRKLVVLPKPGLAVAKNIKGIRYAFGYDSCTNDYKVLRCVNYKSLRNDDKTLKFSNYVSFRKPPTFHVEIWSLATGSWKSLIAADDDDIIPANFYPELFTRSRVVCVNGALHWLQTRRHLNGVSELSEYLVAWFDMAKEIFGETMVPEALRKKLHFQSGREWFISRYRVTIALVKIRNYRFPRGDCVQIWVMEEYGVAASWAKLFTVQLQNVFVLAPLSLKNSGVLGFRKNGEVVLRDVGDGVRLLDPKSEQVSDFLIDGSCCCLNFVDSFVGSFVLYCQPNAISY